MRFLKELSLSTRDREQLQFYYYVFVKSFQPPKIQFFKTFEANQGELFDELIRLNSWERTSFYIRPLNGETDEEKRNLVLARTYLPLLEQQQILEECTPFPTDISKLIIRFLANENYLKNAAKLTIKEARIIEPINLTPLEEFKPESKVDIAPKIRKQQDRANKFGKFCSIGLMAGIGFFACKYFGTTHPNTIKAVSDHILKP